MKIGQNKDKIGTATINERPPATADNTRLAINPYGKLAGFISYF
jgi:hypothetical protein